MKTKTLKFEIIHVNGDKKYIRAVSKVQAIEINRRLGYVQKTSGIARYTWLDKGKTVKAHYEIKTPQEIIIDKAMPE